MRLEDRVAIVTGAGSGIGKATAELFAAEGAHVVIVDWNRESGEQTATAIQQAGGDAIFCYADVSKPNDIRAMVDRVVECHQKLDVLVNNAAIQIMARLDETTEEVWDRIQSVNLKGVFLGCKYGIPAIIRAGGGSVINIASVLGFVADPDLAAYCAAKGGVISLTKVAALAYGPHRVRVNCICPGDVDTPLVQDYFRKDPDPERLRKEVSSKYALRRIASPGEVAQAALFLAGSESSFVTGSQIVIDGGLTIKCY